MDISFTPKVVNKPKTIEATVLVNVHEGKESETIKHLKEVCTRATPDEMALLAKLFASEKWRKAALSMAKKILK